MKYFKITKFFRGGSTTYYASIPSSKKMRYKTWEYQLENWGENTDGGFNYGWTIKVKRIKKIPTNIQPYRILHFIESYLEKA